MSTYTDEYAKKLITPDQAARLVKDNDLIYTSNSMTTPYTFENALAKRVGEVTGVTLFAGPYMGPLPLAEADPEGKSFNYVCHSFGAPERRAIDTKGVKNVNMVPTMNHEWVRFWEGRIPHLKPNVLVLRATPMNRAGYFNFGINCGGYRECANWADMVIIEVVPGMPWVPGGSGEAIHIDNVDYVIESDIPLPVLPGEIPTTPEEEKIAEFIMPYIHDRSCIQLGIGGVPNQIGKMILESDLKDLGLHTELFNDSMCKMIDAGIITNRYKAIDKYRSVFSFIVGVTQETLDWADQNPALAGYNCEYSNSVPNIAINDNFVSVNAFLNIDLFSQVNSESDGFKQISGGGGQLDFHYGAWESRGGIPILCNTSSIINKNGERESRIVLSHKPGTIITTPRQLTAYVATEYGIVNLKGVSVWQRAEKLIEIAHPDFRDQLVEQAAEAGIWSRTNRTAF